MGFFTLTPSAQRYSYLGPAHMIGHVSAVQNSERGPYRKLMALTKSTVFTASLRDTSRNQNPGGAHEGPLRHQGVKAARTTR